jgi:hypothetical protein
MGDIPVCGVYVCVDIYIYVCMKLNYTICWQRRFLINDLTLISPSKN